MVKLTLTDDQVLEIVKQLPQSQKQMLYEYLRSDWPEWAEIMDIGSHQIRKVAAERGVEWDTLSEDEREIFIDDWLHED